MFCENCGEMLDDGVLFCTKCGHRVAQSEAAQIKEEAAESQGEMSEVREDIAEVQGEMSQVREDIAEVRAEMTEAAASAEQAVTEQTVVETMAQAAVASSESQTVQVPAVELAATKPKKPSKKQWLGIALAAVLVVVLALLLANLKVVANSVRKLVMSPQEYYAYIETGEVEEMASGYVTYYDKSLNVYADVTDQSMEYSMDLELGELIYDMFTTALEIEDASGLAKMGIDFNLSMDEKLLFGELAARLDDDRLISVNAVADLEKSMVYAQLPELSQKYISADISENADQISAAVDEYTGMMEVYPEGEVLESIINRYLTMIIDSFEEVSEEKAVVTVEAFEQKSTKLCASMTEAEAVTMLESILTEAKADEELLNMLVAFAVYAEGTDEEAFRTMIMESIDNYLENADTYRAEADADSKLTMTIWVNNKGEVIGREFAISEEEVVISYLMPTKGKEYGYQMLIGIEETMVEILGTGTRTDADMNGEFVVKMDSAETGELELFDVTLEHLNLDKWAEGMEELSYRIKPDKDFYSALGAGAAASLLVGYELIYEVNTEEQEATTSFAIANGEELLFKLDVSAKIGGAKDVTIPAESIAMESDEDLMTWLATIDFDGFMENLKQSDMPAELLEIIEVYVDEFETMISYDEL